MNNEHVLEVLQEAFDLLTDWLVDFTEDDFNEEPAIDEARDRIDDAMIMIRDGVKQLHDEPDVDELQENQDFAQDGEFENTSAADIL